MFLNNSFLYNLFHATIPSKLIAFSNETIPFVIYENNQFILNNKSNMGYNIGPIFKPCTKGI